MADRETVVVTGAGSGIGRAVVQRFADDRARIALIGRNSDSLEGAKREVEQRGGEALVLPTDVSDYAAVEAAATATEEAFGPIDIWVNNAMTTIFSFFDEIEPEEFERATKVTYLGAVWGTKAALERMKPRDRGTIVQVGSAMAYRGIPLQSPYCGAKHAQKGFFESLRTELLNQGSNIHMTMVQLPGLNTPQFEHCRSKMPGHPMPVPPIYQPEVAADAIHWAAHHDRREVLVGFPSLYTIWGNKVAPWLAELYLGKTAVNGQQTDDPPNAKNSDGNLFEPHGGDPGAHGRYDGSAHAHSVQWFLSKHRRAIGLALAGAAAAAGAAAVRIATD